MLIKIEKRFFRTWSDEKGSYLRESDRREDLLNEEDYKGFTSLSPVKENNSSFYLKCSKCGNPQSLHYSNNQEMINANLCFSCLHWRGYAEKIHYSKSVRSNNQHYWIGSIEQGPGFAGQTFYISFDDGTIIKTQNLWYQGTIPEIWRKETPNNVQFITKEQYENEVNNEPNVRSIS